MAYIRVDLVEELVDGQLVAVKAPCDCTAIEGFRVYYPKNGEKLSRVFVMKDAHGGELTGIGNLFMAGSYVTAILNTVEGVAYLQNADTNSYIEAKMGALETQFGGLSFVVCTQSYYDDLGSGRPENTVYIIRE